MTISSPSVKSYMAWQFWPVDVTLLAVPTITVSRNTPRLYNHPLSVFCATSCDREKIVTLLSRLGERPYSGWQPCGINRAKTHAATSSFSPRSGMFSSMTPHEGKAAKGCLKCFKILDCGHLQRLDTGPSLRGFLTWLEPHAAKGFVGLGLWTIPGQINLSRC